MAGHRAFKNASFDGLCPAMTENDMEISDYPFVSC